MGSHSGVRTKIALLGSNGWSNRPIAGMSDIFVYYASLRLSLSKTNSTMHAQYPQLHSPERAPRESKICSREAFPAETPHCRRPNPVSHFNPAPPLPRFFLRRGAACGDCPVFGPVHGRRGTRAAARGAPGGRQVAPDGSPGPPKCEAVKGNLDYKE